MARGVLTDEVKALSIELLGYEITQKELRLLPYTMITWMDNGEISRERIDREENRILNDWETKGFIRMESDLGGRKPYVTPKFYEAVSKILMIGYCSDMLLT